MTPEAEVAGYLARWRPSPAIPAEAAAFAREVVRSAGPGDKERAKSLLAAASRLAAWAAGLGLEPVPGGVAASVGDRAVRPDLSRAVAGGAADAPR